jgi:hypothetical protein
MPNLSGKTILFGEEIDFEDPKNCLVLNNVLIFDHIVDNARRVILLKLGELEYTGMWRNFQTSVALYYEKQTLSKRDRPFIRGRVFQRRAEVSKKSSC